MAKLLTDPEFQRFSELQQKQASFTITSEEADELRDIVARAQKKRDDRAAAMQSIETFIQQFDISPDELFSPEQIGEAARTYGLIPAAKKERVLPPRSPTTASRISGRRARCPTTSACRCSRRSQQVQSVKDFIATPKDAGRCAATIARLERETGAVYADAWLEELSVTRTLVDEAAAKLAA